MRDRLLKRRFAQKIYIYICDKFSLKKKEVGNRLLKKRFSHDKSLKKQKAKWVAQKWAAQK